jgi:hypothetical protein
MRPELAADIFPEHCLSLLGFVVLVQGGNSWPWQIAVNAIGAAILGAAAWKLAQVVAEESNRRPERASAARLLRYGRGLAHKEQWPTGSTEQEQWICKRLGGDGLRRSYPD